MSGKTKIGFVMMAGTAHDVSPAVELVQNARLAAALDSLEAAESTGLFDELIVATNDPLWSCNAPSGCILDFDNPAESFHFGRRLVKVVEQRRLTHVFYMGAGAAPLLDKPQLKALTESLLAKTPVIITNNLHSSDWAAFTPADVIASFAHRIERDNAIGWVLHREAGLPFDALPVSASYRLDIDTPVDLLVLAALSKGGKRLKAALARHKLDTSRLDKAIQVMATEGSHLIVAGRVGSAAWSALERGTLCWVRLFSEERGMVASGRQKRGEARSLLAEHMKSVGIHRFFQLLESWSDAVFWDNRVVLAHRGLWPLDKDRFASDLGWVDAIDEPFLAELTSAALESSIPVVMGGHSLVAGGMLALVEYLECSRS